MNQRPEFQVGDIVTIRRSGYWKIIEIYSWVNTAHATYKTYTLQQVVDGQGRRPVRKARTCRCGYIYGYAKDDIRQREDTLFLQKGVLEGHGVTF